MKCFVYVGFKMDVRPSTSDDREEDFTTDDDGSGVDVDRIDSEDDFVPSDDESDSVDSDSSIEVDQLERGLLMDEFLLKINYYFYNFSRSDNFTKKV